LDDRAHTRMIALSAGSAVATIVPAVGGRVGSLTVDGTDLIVTGDASDRSTLWGSFPLAPWAGRLGHGRFTHDGITHQLAIDLPPHAIHGTVASRPWTVEHADDRTVQMSCELGDGWPLGGTAHQTIALGADALRCTLGVTAGDSTMPVTIGWHPWFRATDVHVDATAMYERAADDLPTGVLVAPRARPWNDCFLTTQPVRVRVAPYDVTIASDCDHVVVFDELAIGISVEPQSGPPDALNLRADVVAPGGKVQRTMTITWQRHPSGAVATRG
jgi:aldose 1-epimerase